MKGNVLRALILTVVLNLILLLYLLVTVPSAFGCTFAALKSVTLVTDPPRPIKGKPFTLSAVLLYGGGMGHGNMLTAATNAVSSTLSLPDGMEITKGDKQIQTTTPEFSLGYETTFTLRWTVVANNAGRQHIGIEVQNTTLGEGQESMVTESETGLLSWEVLLPDMKDARIESGDKEKIDDASLALMPSLHLREWHTLSGGDIVFTDTDGTRYSVANGELALGKEDPSPVLVTDLNGNTYVASDGYVVIGEGPEVFAPTLQPSKPSDKETLSVQARIIGNMDNGQAILAYSDDGTSWKSIAMGRLPGDTLWKGEIPPTGKDGASINYSLQVTDGAGQTVTLPRYSVRTVASDRVAEGVRNVSLLALAHILLAIGVVVFWARWDLSKRAKRAWDQERRILAGGEMALQPQRITGILDRLQRPAATERGMWWIGFVVLLVFAILCMIIGLVTNQFQIINLIIKMG